METGNLAEKHNFWGTNMAGSLDFRGKGTRLCRSGLSPAQRALREAAREFSRALLIADAEARLLAIVDDLAAEIDGMQAPDAEAHIRARFSAALEGLGT